MKYNDFLELLSDAERSLSEAIMLKLVPAELNRCNFCFSNVRKEKCKTSKINYVFRCCNSLCRKTTSTLKYTIFENSNISIKDSLSIIFLYCIGIPIYQATSFIYIDSHHLGEWYSVLRNLEGKILKRYMNQKIGGLGMTVEVDETHLFTRKFNTGRIFCLKKYGLSTEFVVKRMKNLLP